MRGRPVSPVVRQVMAKAMDRRRRLGYRVGRPPRAHSTAEDTALLAHAVLAAAGWAKCTVRQLLQPPAQGAAKFQRGRQFAMYLARQADVPDEFVSAHTPWTALAIREAVAQVQESGRARHCADVMWRRPLPQVRGEDATHPLLARMQHDTHQRLDRQRMERIRDLLQIEHNELLTEIAERTAAATQVGAALRALQEPLVIAIRTRRTSVEIRGQAAKIVAIVNTHPNGIRTRDVARESGMPLHAVTKILCFAASQRRIRRLSMAHYAPMLEQAAA